MTLWVRALLDPAEIQQTSSHSSSPIATPPRFSLPPLKQITLEPPSLARTRSRRSTSPVKSYAMTPSKRRTRTSKEAKEQKEAAQQQLRELEALTAATIREEKENEETEKTKMNGTAPVSTKKRTTRKATKKVEPVAVSEETEALSGLGEEKQETSQSAEPVAGPKERINGAVKDTPTKKEQKKEEEKEEGREKKDEPADKQDEPKQEEETVQKDEPEAAEETNHKETEALNEELPSSSQKDNIKSGVFQTPRKTADPDELPMTIGEMESPGKDAASMIDKAREMLAAVTPQQLKKTFGSPLKNEVKRDDDESEDKKEDESSTGESTAESAESKKRKVDTLEAEDKETDAATKDSEDSGSDTEERPAKRTRVQLVEQVRRERFRHRGLVGLVTAVGIA
ncbi:hypothetical protein KEM56_000608 [Ascosphaera pollenicola]|nr:hypothetical protein KEM56_000608 [Ascosphaera pollenicola]